MDIPKTWGESTDPKPLGDVLSNSDLKNKYIAYLSSGGAGAVGGKVTPSKKTAGTPPTDKAA